MKSGTIFDNILVTDDVDYAKQVAEDTWAVTKKGEKEMKDKVSYLLLRIVVASSEMPHT